MKLRWLGREGRPLEEPEVYSGGEETALVLQMKKGLVEVVFESREEVMKYVAQLIYRAPPLRRRS
jgi:hypothetical protein